MVRSLDPHLAVYVAPVLITSSISDAGLSADSTGKKTLVSNHCSQKIAPINSHADSVVAPINAHVDTMVASKASDLQPLDDFSSSNRNTTQLE